MDSRHIDDRAIGQIGLLMAAQELMKAGYQVAVPLVDVGYDLVAMKDCRLWRIQVKATARTGSKSNRVKARRGVSKTDSYTAEHCDAIVAVHIRRNAIVCMTLEQLKGRVWISFHDASCAKPFDALQ
jgi:hypothetical protein